MEECIRARTGTECVTLVTIVNGLVGGLVATVVMTAVMMLLRDDDPPTPAVLWAKYVADGSPDEYMMPGMMLHLVYGTLMGGVFAALAGVGVISLGTIGGAILWGVVWGVVLVIVAAAFWMTIILGMDPGDASEMATQVGFHVVYGVVLAGWLFYDVIGLG